MSFLTAEWKKLAFVNYQVDPAILKKYLPYGTELDLWQDRCYVSVIGFMFLQTRLLGVKIPFHTNFEEVNLRFYVKRWDNNVWKRGVVFIKEIVPKPAITFVANTIYKENYQTMNMRHVWEEKEDSIHVMYAWQHDKKWNNIDIIANPTLEEITIGSEAEFITEHYWGYASVHDKKTNEYEVRHPRWGQYTVQNSVVNIDFDGVYGSDFSFLANQQPVSVMLAEGSAISIEAKRVIA